ncbi:MAG: hypothetical protein Q8Q09_08830 [Deltaproteobacteria bacterium]|nr:hypothetical protein [Deltaproteobacteria bacterium]
MSSFQSVRPVCLNLRGSFAARAIVGATLALAVTAPGADAFAQGVLTNNTRGTALAAHIGGGYGSYAVSGQSDFELQMHFAPRYVGAGLAVGVSMPIGFGYGFGLEGRFLYDIQLIPNAAFFITPYIGAIVGYWNWDHGGVNGGYAWVGPQFGVDLNFVLFDRLLLGVRPLGVTVPVLFGNGVYWAYHSALTIGVTF